MMQQNPWEMKRPGLGEGGPRGGMALARQDSKEDVRPDGVRMMELEAENLRLQRLVAELLMKNQQLREGLDGLENLA